MPSESQQVERIRIGDGVYVDAGAHEAALQAVADERDYVAGELKRAIAEREQAEKQLEELRHAAERVAAQGRGANPEAAGHCLVSTGSLRALDASLTPQPDTASEAPRCGG